MRVYISGVRHHKCDWCKEDFTETEKPHLTVEIGERSGIANRHTELSGWRIAIPFKPNRMHFCIDQYGNSNCLAMWLTTVVRFKPMEYVG